MKNKKIFILIILFVLSTLYTYIYAHGGKTDSSGGHYNRSTGEYHYHHGYSAHQHPNGICPYDNNTNTSTSSSKNYENKTNNDKTSSKNSSDNLNEIIEKIREESKEQNSNSKNDDSDFVAWLCFAISGSLIGLAFYQTKKETTPKKDYIYCNYCRTKSNIKDKYCNYCGKELKK